MKKCCAPYLTNYNLQLAEDDTDQVTEVSQSVFGRVEEEVESR